jgi:hypothetical protein
MQKKQRVNVMKCLKYVAWFSLILFLATASLTALASADHCVVVYFDGGNPGSTRYVETLESALKSAGVANVVKHDYSANDNALRDLSNLRDFFDVPAEFFGSATTFIDGKYIFEGFFPTDTMVDFVRSNPGLDKLIAAQGPSSEKYLLRRDDLTLECNSSQRIVDSLSSVTFLGGLTTANALVTLGPCLAVIGLVTTAVVAIKIKRRR